MANINVRFYNLSTVNGAELGTFTDPAKLGDAFVAHFGKGYRALANKLVADLRVGKDTTRTEHVLGVRVEKGFMPLS